MHALIIEDEFLTAQLIEDLLSEIGYISFSYAVDENTAVSAARERLPDLVTSDVRLLDGCGIKAVERIRDGTRVPVLFITGSAETVRKRCPEAIVIEKPFGMTDLENGVRQALQAARAS